MGRTRGFFGGRKAFAFPEVGTRFDDRYFLEVRLGSGGGSAVFKALDTRLSRPVAIKILAPDEMDDAGIARFKREAMTIARLNHPRIVTIYDFATAEGRLPYLVLELVTGDDLWAVMYEQNRNLSTEDVLKLGLKILDVLDYAHQQGVIHRDLKPENVMIEDADLNPKVMDFGLAYIRGQNRITQDGVVSGSAYYLAPEVAEGKRSDHRVDLYALGVMLYEMVTGHLPFYAENPLAVINQHLYEAPVPPTELNPALAPTFEAVILKLLAKSPDDRFESAKDVMTALAHLDQQALQPRLHTSQHILDRIDRTRLVGREVEWMQLRDSWQKAHIRSADSHPVVMLIGEAGTGKNQMVQQLVLEARHGGARVLNTQCYETTTPQPYQPMVEILRDALRAEAITLDPAMTADLAKLVPDVLKGHNHHLPPLSPDAERMRLYEHVAQFLIQLSEQQPLVLVVEYLHCTDSSSLALLHYVARRIRGFPILMLGTYRPSELTHRHPLIGLIRDLVSQDLVEQITLRRLNLGDTETLIQTVFDSPLTPRLATMIYEKTQGNIFFTRELLKTLVIDEHIRWDEGANQWQVYQLDQMELPNSIRSIISQVLSKMDESAARVLADAAVIGSEFRFRLLAAITDEDEDTLSEVIEAGLAARLIEEVKEKGSREETYAFINLATHQTLLESLNQRRKARLHLKIGQALETVYPNQINDNLEAIARHYSLGARTDAEIDKAIRYLDKAAQRAARIFALLNACELYNLALDLSQEDVSPQREERILTLRERRGMIYQQLGEFSLAADDLEAVLASPLVKDDRRRQRRVKIELGQVCRRLERFEVAIQNLTEAVSISRELEDNRLVADALFFLGATYWSLGKIKIAVQHQDEALALIKPLGLSDSVTMRVMHGVAECCGRKVDYDCLFSLANESLTLARELGDMEYQSENLMIMGVGEVDRGNFERAQAVLESDLETSERAGLNWHRMGSLAVYGYAKAAAGDYREGLRILTEAKEIVLTQHRGFLQTLVLNNLGRCYLELEALEQARATFELAIERAQRHRISWSEAAIRGHWAMAQIRLGNLEVGTVLEETLAKVLEDGDLRHIPLLYSALAELEIARQQLEAALGWLDKMHALATELGQPLQIVKANRWRAIIWMKQGRYTEARDLLENTLELAVTIHTPRLTWQLHQTLSQIYDYTNQPMEANKCRKRVKGAIEEMMQNIADPDLQKGLATHVPTIREGRSLTTTFRLLVLADAYGTVIRQSIKDNLADVMRCDALILLGDLPQQTYPSLREDFKLPMAGLCVFGNHDHETWESWMPRYNFEHLHLRISTLKIGGREITFGGFSGSERYRTQEINLLQWEEKDAQKHIRKLPPCDILITHTIGTPPPNYPVDYTHRGLRSLNEYIDREQPKVALHGHFHQNYQLWRGKTQIIGCYGAVLVQCMVGADGVWQVEVEPLLKF